MKGTLRPWPKFLIYCVVKSIRHPRTPITYYYCPACKIRFAYSQPQCPKCGDKVTQSPERVEENPVPWYGTVVFICLGILCWVLGVKIPVAGLDEAGRILVYVPLGSLFGMAVR